MNDALRNSREISLIGRTQQSPLVGRTHEYGKLHQILLDAERYIWSSDMPPTNTSELSWVTLYEARDICSHSRAMLDLQRINHTLLGLNDSTIEQIHNEESSH